MLNSFRQRPWSGRRFVRLIGYAVAVVLCLTALAFMGTVWLIEFGVRAASEAALHDQPGDAVLALMTYVESPNHTLRERNRAVWALGRLRDPRALPLLERHFTDRGCDHGRLLCQHELRKAIALCLGA
jgi:hypothetical protein